MRIAGVVAFLIAAFAAAGFPMGGQTAAAPHSFLLPSMQCADIVRAGVLPSQQAELLRSGGFADSMDAVASGTSYYSPGFVPPQWKTAAATWREQVAGRSVVRPGASDLEIGDSGLCPSSLIFRAFLDYRAKTGKQDLKPVYPYMVRKAAADLTERFEIVAQRARRIEISLREAERMGAKECSPSELSIAWAELEVAGRQAAENGYDIGRTEAVFAHAERAASNLLVKRRIASSGQFACYSR
ncbi:MAG: hypothetical protein Kow00128_01250 [Deltaproteobacteria bacterium]